MNIRMKKIWRIGVIVICLIILSIFAIKSYQAEKDTYMGIKRIRIEDIVTFGEESFEDISGFITYDGERAAIDVKTKTIYASVNIEKDSSIRDVHNKINILNSEYDLYFVEDNHMNNLYEAIQNNYVFKIIAAHKEGYYICYNLVFTTLPILSMGGTYSYTNEDNREVMYGDFLLWTPFDSDVEKHTLKKSHVEWNVRGRTLVNAPKKSWKISLKKSEGKNNKLALLGMGEDDDWILNPLYKDDTKVREKLFMDLWNGMAEKATYNKKMSTGEYVEVVINGEYQGLYLLQRRIDRKYLNLSDKDVLFKAGKTYLPQSVEEAYEIEYSLLTTPDTYALLDGIYMTKDCSQIVLDNFVDITLFMNLGATFDNVGYINVYYVFEYLDDGNYDITYILWDTDMSFGTQWIEEFEYNFDATKDALLERQENGSMQVLHPELEEFLTKRWKELRKTELCEQNILSYVECLEQQIENSGAIERDRNLWGSYNGEEDTLNNLKRFITYRLNFLDKNYCVN